MVLETMSSKFTAQRFEDADVTETDKENFTIALDRQDSIRSDRPSQPLSWKQALIRFGPLSGILGLLLAISSIFAALGILVGSQNSPVSSWAGEPSIYLAICTAVANQAMRYATIQGVAIAWWLRASRGSTIARLHVDHRSGTSIRGALASGRHMGLLGLACIFSTFVAIDGPLLQKSSKTVPAPILGQSLPVKINMAQELPSAFSGGWLRGVGVSPFNDSIPTPSGVTPNNVATWSTLNLQYNLVPDYYSSEPIKEAVSGCTGLYTCKATIRAPALARTSCKTSIMPVNYSQPVGRATSNLVGFGPKAPPLDLTQFLISLALDTDGLSESLVLVTAFHRGHECAGDLELTTCSL